MRQLVGLEANLGCVRSAGQFQEALGMWKVNDNLNRPWDQVSSPWTASRKPACCLFRPGPCPGG